MNEKMRLGSGWNGPAGTPPVIACRAEAVAISRAGREFRLVAARPIAEGEVLFTIEGQTTLRPSRFSLQIGEGLHIDLDPVPGVEEIFDRYFWRFLNHGCEPNARVVGLDVIAVRAIARWDDVTFHYNTTEFDMAEPFACRCGAASCLGEIQGFKHLSPAERARLRPWLARHLLKHLEPSAESAPVVSA